MDGYNQQKNEFPGYQNDSKSTDRHRLDGVGQKDENNVGESPVGGKRKDVVDLFCTQVDHDLLVSKLFYFFFFGAFGSLFPLISIYFKQLGMSAAQAGVLVGIRPFVEFASAPFWGRFADKFRKGKVLLMFSVFCWIVFTLALNFIYPFTSYCITVFNRTEFKLETAKTNFLEEDGWKHVQARLEQDARPGLAPEYLDAYGENIHGYNNEKHSDLVKPPWSTRVYLQSAVEEVFLLLLLVIVIGEFFSAPAITLADACTLHYLGDAPENYGKQRMYGSVGWAVSMFIVGIALDYALVFPGSKCPQMDNREKNYTLCFAAFSVLMGCALITSTQFRFPSDADRPDTVAKKIMDIQTNKVEPILAENTRAKGPEAKEFSRGPKWFSVLKTFATPHYASFLFVTWWFGFGIGLVFCFLFWHLQDIGGSPSIYGIASVINHISEVAAYFFSFRLINSIGHMKVLYIGLLANVARFLYVSWLGDPWFVLPFELVQGITHATVWAASSSYISLAAPPMYKSTAQGILQALHHGIGRACGTLIGGLIISRHGSAVAFRAYGIASLVILILFFAINRFLKAGGIKYQPESLIGEHGDALAPHGIPMNVPYSPTEESLAYSAAPQGYGSTDPTQAAYDRYVSEPYDKPVRFEQLPTDLGKR